MYTATIIRHNKTRRIHIRIGASTQTGGDVTVIDILNGGDRDELRKRAELFVENVVGEAVTP